MEVGGGDHAARSMRSCPPTALHVHPPALSAVTVSHGHAGHLTIITPIYTWE